MVMTAEKDNKVYSIDEGQMAAYQVAGYDIYGDDGNVIAYGAGKTVAYEDYMRISQQNRKQEPHMTTCFGWSKTRKWQIRYVF